MIGQGSVVAGRRSTSGTWWRSATLVSGLLLLPTLAWAQGRPPVTRAQQEKPYSLQLGLRLTTGAEVSFGNLGEIPSNLDIGAGGALTGIRFYHDGAINLDAPRTTGNFAEVDAAGAPLGNLVDNGDGTFDLVDVGGNTVARGVAFQTGQTRIYGFQDASQVSGADLSLSTFSATSQGGTASAESSLAGGFELTVARDFGKLLNGRVQWGVQLGVGLTSVGSSTRGTVPVSITQTTDTYTAIAPLPTTPTPFIAPSSGDLVLGTTTIPGGLETTVPVGTTGVRSSSVFNGTATGDWEISGAYYSARLGPSVRAFLTEQLAFNASVGASFSIATTEYSASESIDLPNLARPARVSASDDTSEFLIGFYAEVAAEWWFSRTTGIFLGGSYQSLGEYDQQLGGRTATIDLGSGLGARAGLVVRF